MLCPLKFKAFSTVWQNTITTLWKGKDAKYDCECEKEKCAWWSTKPIEYFTGIEDSSVKEKGQEPADCCAIKLMSESIHV